MNADPSAVVAARLAELVDRYARQVYPAVLEQHPGASVSSPLGVWLLLAACVTVATGEERAALEDALGCPAAEAGEMLAAFMASPPPALKAAMAMWVSAVDFTAEVLEWARKLPPQLESGPMPTQEEADDWARRHTLGLIPRFPIQIDAFTRIVLASALATKVSWPTPFELVPAGEHLGKASPWRGQVARLLWDRQPAPLVGIAGTRAAGLVAFHCSAAVEELMVISVSADPSTPREAVLAAAHELIGEVRSGRLPQGLSLFDLPAGAGHSWEIDERETATRKPGEHVERIDGTSLPAWRIESKLDLKQSDVFAALPALEVMRGQVGPSPLDQTEAAQAAVASFTRFGFEAAAVTAFGVRAMAMAPPRERGLLRTATLRFDHPYAAIAVAGNIESITGGPQRPGLVGLPLFTAWVATPQEPEDDDEG